MDRTTVASDEEIRAAVRERYAGAARSVLEGSAASCCGSDVGCCSSSDLVNAMAIRAYDPQAIGELPEAAVLAALGCGNPTALADLHPGEVVLDLGSGGGIDVLLSAKRVAPDGVAYGLDMTDEMLELAERNRREAGVDNARFLKGQIEAVPLPDASVDVIISNCVINLSADKDQVLREAFRVLRPGGRLAVSDIVVQGRLLPPVCRSLRSWSACVAGALTEDEYQEKLAAAGFDEIEVEVTAMHRLTDLLDSSSPSSDLAALAAAQEPVGTIVSAFIRARKPLAGS